MTLSGIEPATFRFVTQHLNHCAAAVRRQVGMKNSSYLSVYEDGTECSETSAYKIQAPGNLPRKKHTKLRLDWAP